MAAQHDSPNQHLFKEALDWLTGHVNAFTEGRSYGKVAVILNFDDGKLVFVERRADDTIKGKKRNHP